MSRIDDIKERHTAGYVTSFATPHEVISKYNEDVIYLLSRLEIADKALDRIVNSGEDRPDAYPLMNIADEALQQLRS